MSWETFKLSELRLDQKNYRTGNTATQRDALAAIIEDQKGKLVNLARDILDVGLSPGEPTWVTRDMESSGKYVVLEGNRRLAALKLLETPALADGTQVERGFRALSEKYAEKPIRQIEARVFATREEALPWQRRRHMTNVSGVGIQRWETMAKARANVDQGAKAPRFLIVWDFLNDEADPEWQSLTDVLDNKWTTVDRVLDAPALTTKLGVKIDSKSKAVTFENGDAEAGKTLLRRVLQEIASASFKFAEVEADSDREKFMDRFTGLSVKPKPVNPASKGATPVPTSTPPAPAKRSRGTPLTQTARTTLAPKTGPQTFRVDGTRLNDVYRECRTIQIKDNENAAALLLRVFIELSSEALLSEKNIPIPTAAKAKGKTSWDDFGINLTMKIRAVLDYLDSSGKDKKFQKVRVALDPQSQTNFSITTLHGYFHNRLLNPDAIGLREAWDAWNDYLRYLHSAR